MNVFNDLVEELKEENLLEETVIEKNAAEHSANYFASQSAPAAAQFKTAPEFGFAKNDLPANNPAVADFDFSPVAEIAPEAVSETEFEMLANVGAETASFHKSPHDEMEFYRRRAIDEVTSLQMVEHVFSGVEREQMRILPKPFNDIAVKKALHDFLHVSKNSPANENAQAEFKLMQETESWCSALSHRDKHLSVSSLRRFCETTKPSLSTQALVALARFYRNLPHTESVRSKFDMVLTRLFTAEIEGERRRLLFSREEMMKQINELYADWASVSLYSVEDETDLLLTTVKFDDFLAEAQEAESFDELVRKDFYNRLRLFKESLDDKFYAPLVLASAVESNVFIGNRYVELLEKERGRTSAETIESQYSFLLDQAISDATSKTLQLVDLLKENTKPVAAPLNEPKETLSIPETKVENKTTTAENKVRSGFFGVSKWIVAAFCVVIFISAGLFFYVEYYNPPKVSPDVQKVNMENSLFKDYLKAARINQEAFIGVVSASWDGANAEKKQEILGNLLNIGHEKGFNKVHLLNKEGLTVGYASPEEIKISNP